MRLFSKILFSIMFLSFICYSANDEIHYCNTNLNSDSISIMLIGITLSILFVSLFFMYGKFMNNSEVEGTYMVELQQIGLTVVMIFLITGGLELLCNVGLTDQGLLISNKDNIYDSVRKMQIETMDKTMNFYISLMDTINFYSILGSAQAGFNADGFSIGFSPFPGGVQIAQTLAPLGQSVLIAYFAQAFQYSLFEFSRSKIFLMLLPIGLVLRSFPITRKFGGVLIALVLGLSYLYPLFLNFGFLFVNPSSIKPVLHHIVPPIVYLVGVSGSMLALSYIATLEPGITFMVIGIILGVIMIAGSIAEMIQTGGAFTVLSTMSLTGDVFIQLISLVYDSFGNIILITFFMPALMILILGAVVRSLSATIGTETDITGILRAV